MSSNTSPRTWLITGCSSGFGLLLARAVLQHGDNVIATSRNPSKTPDFIDEIESSSSPSGRGKWLTLDVSWSATQIQAAIKETHSIFGRIDVLVNNVGYAAVGAAEDIPEDVAKQQFETNFWGTLRVTQAVLPIMRSQQQQATGSGGGVSTIVNISSVAGLTVQPSCSIYSASKFALEAWSEGLAREIASFGVRVLIIEPGAFRTGFLTGSALQTTAPSEPYKNGVVQEVLGKFQDMDGKQAGDAGKAVQRIYEAVTVDVPREDLGKIEKLRLLLGKDCFDRVSERLKLLQQNVNERKADAMGLAFDN